MTIEMTDQELLKYAAKAVGFIDYPEDSIEQGGFWHTDKDKAPFGRRIPKREWDPLLSDADAFRLMVDLNLTEKLCFLNKLHEENTTWAPDYRKAHRRAIVRAAAEIGRNMTE